MSFPAGAHLWNIGTARMKNINNLHSQTHNLHNSLIQSKARHKSNIWQTTVKTRSGGMSSFT
jgi:hypothetical protein